MILTDQSAGLKCSAPDWIVCTRHARNSLPGFQINLNLKGYGKGSSWRKLHLSKYKLMNIPLFHTIKKKYCSFSYLTARYIRNVCSFCFGYAFVVVVYTLLSMSVHTSNTKITYLIYTSLEIHSNQAIGCLNS